MSDSESGEAYDTFDNTAGAPATSFVFDLAHVTATAQPRGRNRPLFSSGASRGTRSAATTQLASDVGSTVIRSRIPFLKSFTFFDPKIYYQKDDADNEDINNNSSSEEEDDDITVEINSLQHWDIHLQDPPPDDPNTKKSLLQKINQSKLGTKLNLHRKPHIVISNFEGLLEYSSFQSGDSLLSINKHVMDPKDTTAQCARDFMNDCLEKEGVLNIVTENPSGDDILIHVTVIKPRHDMNYTELGLQVWNWPYLCVHQVNEGSIFEHTPVREMDQIAAINDIDCTKMRGEAFARCVSELPTELTLTLIRRKHRYTGSFK